jgi:hypothetical protein
LSDRRAGGDDVFVEIFEQLLASGHHVGLSWWRARRAKAGPCSWISSACPKETPIIIRDVWSMFRKQG